MQRIHAFVDDALGEHDAVGLAEELAAGRVGAVEVIDAAIARVEKVAPDLNAVAHTDYARARARAVSPRPGFFAGVPTFVKDNSDVAGWPTGQGSDAYEARPAAVDGDFARLFGATGLIPLGKTQMSEFGFSAVAEHPRIGPVRSPWSLEHPAGASSSGSAALVAAGAVPLAHANDGGGSIRIPAAVNGLVGLKPTRYRLAQDRTLREMPVRIVADGVVTRTVRDTAAFLREAERVYHDRRLPKVGDVRRSDSRRLRVAVVVDSVAGAGATPQVREQTRRTADLLADLGHRVEEAAPPVGPGFADDFVLYWSLLAAFIVRTGPKRLGPAFDPARLDNLTLGLAEHCRRNLRHLPAATAKVASSQRLSRRFFRHHDVVLTPTLATPTPLLGHLDPTQDYETIMGRLLDWVAFTPLQNATGDPAISLPLAASADGMPLGMMLGAAWGQEATLLSLAYELERARPFPRITDPH